jgi:hypothetical protein
VLDIVREGAGSPGIKTFPTFEQQQQKKNVGKEIMALMKAS